MLPVPVATVQRSHSQFVFPRISSSHHCWSWSLEVCLLCNSEVFGPSLYHLWNRRWSIGRRWTILFGLVLSLRLKVPLTLIGNLEQSLVFWKTLLLWLLRDCLLLAWLPEKTDRPSSSWVLIEHRHHVLEVWESSTRKPWFFWNAWVISSVDRLQRS